MEGNQEFKSRINRILVGMQEAKLDGLLIYSTAWRKDNVRYVSNFSFLGPYATVVVDRNGEASLLLSARSDVERARQRSWIDDVEAVPGVVSGVARRLGKLGNGGRVGVAGLELASAGLIEGLRQRLHGVELVSASKLYNQVRMVKSPAEVASIRKAGALADAGFRAFLDNIVAGKKEYELIADVDRVVKAAGAEDNFMLMASGGAEVRAMSPARNKSIERGEMLRTEVTPLYEGYWAQICRTVVFGEPSAERRRSFDIFYRAQEAALSAMRPGMTAHDVARLQNEVFAAEGFGEYVSNKYTRTRGHGHGMHFDEPPSIEEGEETVLQPGMVIIVHPNTFLPLAGYMVLGDPVLVTETGCERLIATERKLFCVE